MAARSIDEEANLRDVSIQPLARVSGAFIETTSESSFEGGTTRKIRGSNETLYSSPLRREHSVVIEHTSPRVKNCTIVYMLYVFVKTIGVSIYGRLASKCGTVHRLPPPYDDSTMEYHLINFINELSSVTIEDGSINIQDELTAGCPFLKSFAHLDNIFAYEHNHELTHNIFSSISSVALLSLYQKVMDLRYLREELLLYAKAYDSLLDEDRLSLFQMCEQLEVLEVYAENELASRDLVVFKPETQVLQSLEDISPSNLVAIEKIVEINREQEASEILELSQTFESDEDRWQKQLRRMCDDILQGVQDAEKTIPYSYSGSDTDPIDLITRIFNSLSRPEPKIKAILGYSYMLSNLNISDRHLRDFFEQILNSKKEGTQYKILDHKDVGHIYNQLHSEKVSNLISAIALLKIGGNLDAETGNRIAQVIHILNMLNKACLPRLNYEDLHNQEEGLQLVISLNEETVFTKDTKKAIQGFYLWMQSFNQFWKEHQV